QLIAGVDGRGCCQDRTQVMQDTLDGSGNNSAPLARSSDLTGSGIRRANSVIGTFTADSTSQTIFISGATDPTISGYVLSQLGDVASLTVEVNTQSGLVRMFNDTDREFIINGYEITSAGGALDAVGWNGFADQNLDPVNGGDDPGETWLEDATSSSTVLSEGFLLGGTTFAMDDSQTLGMAYSPAVFGQGNDGDLAFRFTTTEGAILNGNVVYTSPTGPPCDFNGDGLCNVVDIDLMFNEGPIAFGVSVAPGNQFDLDADGDIDLADRDLWLAQAAAENGLASPYKLGDGNLDGVVDVPDFNIWNSNKFTARILWSEGNFNGDDVVDVSDFNLWNGNKFTASDAATVPEPAALFGLLLGGLALLKLRRG
ncbi:MAG: PEP-CTERM sorting domain-containing protein, partial [Planctomycetota bacterium]